MDGSYANYRSNLASVAGLIPNTGIATKFKVHAVKETPCPRIGDGEERAHLRAVEQQLSAPREREGRHVGACLEPVADAVCPFERAVG